MASLRGFLILFFLNCSLLFGAESVKSVDNNDPSLIEAASYTMEKAPEFAALIKQVNRHFARAVIAVEDSKKQVSRSESPKRSSTPEPKQKRSSTPHAIKRSSSPILSMMTGMYGDQSVFRDEYRSNMMNQAGNIDYIRELTGMDMYLFCYLCIDKHEYLEVAEKAITDHLQSQK